MIEALLILYIYALIISTMCIALYGILFKPNIVKKIIALTILGDTANTFIIYLGYRLVESPKPPILPTLNPSQEELTWFKSVAVDPLPQALVITAIVINVAVTAFLAFTCIKLYEHYGTIEYDEINRIKKGEIYD